MKRVIISILLMALPLVSSYAQKLETQGGLDSHAVSTKVKDGVASSRVIILSTAKLSYTTNMGGIPQEDVGSGIVNGMNVDTLYFFS